MTGNFEIWKDAFGYEGSYMVSNLGRIKSVERKIADGRLRKSIIMAQSKHCNDGYMQVCLRKNGASSVQKVHRIIAFTFISNPENKPTVNHINGVRDDNRVENLEWATVKENVQHSFDYLGRKSTWYKRFGVDHPQTRQVLCITNGKKYLSPRDAASDLGLNHKCIRNVCCGQIKTLKGYSFKYIDTY